MGVLFIFLVVYAVNPLYFFNSKVMLDKKEKTPREIAKETYESWIVDLVDLEDEDEECCGKDDDCDDCEN